MARQEVDIEGVLSSKNVNAEQLWKRGVRGRGDSARRYSTVNKTQA